MDAGAPHTSNSIPLEERFWSRVAKRGDAECWNWTGSKTEMGYGILRFQGKAVYAHRHSYLINKGDLGDKLVRHTCDNPSCCNPGHLILGDKRANADDMFSRNRHPNSAGRLTELHLRVASRLIELGLTQKAIAKLFGVHFITLWKLLHGYRKPLICGGTHG